MWISNPTRLSRRTASDALQWGRLESCELLNQIWLRWLRMKMKVWRVSEDNIHEFSWLPGSAALAVRCSVGDANTSRV